MRVTLPWPVLLAVLLGLTSPIVAQDGPSPSGDPAEAAQVFRRAMQASDASLLRPILPSRGRVQLRFESLGDERGFFSAEQVESLIRDIFESDTTIDLAIDGVETEKGDYTLVHGSLKRTDSTGRASSARIHLAFQPEDGRWVLREIRETRR